MSDLIDGDFVCVVDHEEDRSHLLDRGIPAVMNPYVTGDKWNKQEFYSYYTGKKVSVFSDEETGKDAAILAIHQLWGVAEKIWFLTGSATQVLKYRSTEEFIDRIHDDQPINEEDIKFWEEAGLLNQEEDLKKPDDEPQEEPDNPYQEQEVNPLTEPQTAPLKQPANLRDIVLKVQDAFSERVTLQNDKAYTTVALWILHTYVYDLFDTTPYLLFESPTRGCGKTTALKVLSKLCSKPELLNSLTGAVLFRITDQNHPTLLIDEAERFKTNHESVLDCKDVLRSGWESTGRVLRCDTSKGNKLRSFSTYCPKALAAIGGLEGALLDRYLVPHMKRTTGGLVPTYSHLLKKDLDPIQEEIEQTLLSYREVIEQTWHSMPRESYWTNQGKPRFVGRDGDINFPLLIIGKIAGSDIEAQGIEAAVEFLGFKASMTIAETTNDSKNSEILTVARQLKAEKKFVLKEGKAQILVNYLIQPLMNLEGEWAKILEGKDASNIGTYLTIHRDIYKKQNTRLEDDTGTAIVLDSLIKELEGVVPIVHQQLLQIQQSIDNKPSSDTSGSSFPEETVPAPPTSQNTNNKEDKRNVVGVGGDQGVGRKMDESLFEDLADVTESGEEQDNGTKNDEKRIILSDSF